MRTLFLCGHHLRLNLHAPADNGTSCVACPKNKTSCLCAGLCLCRSTCCTCLKRPRLKINILFFLAMPIDIHQAQSNLEASIAFWWMANKCLHGSLCVCVCVCERERARLWVYTRKVCVCVDEDTLTRTGNCNRRRKQDASTSRKLPGRRFFSTPMPTVTCRQRGALQRFAEFISSPFSVSSCNCAQQSAYVHFAPAPTTLSTASSWIVCLCRNLSTHSSFSYRPNLRVLVVFK